MVDRGLHLGLGGLDHGIAAGLLVAARDERVQRERIAVGDGVLLLDQDAEDAGLEERKGGQIGGHGKLRGKNAIVRDMKIAAALVAVSLALPFAGAYAGPVPEVRDAAGPADRQARRSRPDSRAESEFILRDKTEVHRGQVWLGYLDYKSKWGEDKRYALEGIVEALRKGGWEVMMRDEPRNPPLATLRYEKDGTTAWAIVEVFDLARVAVLEPGGPGITMIL